MRKSLLTMTVIAVIFTFNIHASAHWADEYMERGQSEGWIDSQITNPDDIPTYEQLILSTAYCLGICPDKNQPINHVYYIPREVAEQYADKENRFADGDNISASKNLAVNSFIDTEGTALEESRVLETAMCTGMVVTQDYSDGRLMPDRPSMRRDAIVMISRAMGLGSEISGWIDKTDELEPQFTDWYETEDWLRRFSYVLQKHGILSGDSEGRMNVNSPITFGELSSMLCAARSYEMEGIDYDIEVFKHFGGDISKTKGYKMTRMAPAQIIDGIVYLSTFDLYKSLYFYSGYISVAGGVHRASRCLEYNVSDSHIKDTVTYYYNQDQSGTETRDMGCPVRMLLGKPMIPVYNINSDTYVDKSIPAEYNSENKELHVVWDNYGFGEDPYMD